jgi:hypothetical protein
MARRRRRRWVSGVLVTPDLVQAVHETECLARGHDLTINVDHEGGEPNRIRCRHCDRIWEVGEGTSSAGPGAVARVVCNRADANA